MGCVNVVFQPSRRGLFIHTLGTFTYVLIIPMKRFPCLMKMNVPLLFPFTCSSAHIQITITWSSLQGQFFCSFFFFLLLCKTKVTLLMLCNLGATLFQPLHDNGFQASTGWVSVHSDATGDASSNSATCHKTAIKPQFYERVLHMSKECSYMPTYSTWLLRKILNPNRIDTNLYQIRSAVIIGIIVAHLCACKRTDSQTL